MWEFSWVYGDKHWANGAIHIEPYMAQELFLIIYLCNYVICLTSNVFIYFFVCNAGGISPLRVLCSS